MGVIDGTLSDHGRIETRKISTTMAFNHYLDSPLAGQAFVIQRESIDKKTGEHTHEVVYGVTSCTSEKANAEKILKTNREHWGIENSCHYVIDWNYNEDLCRIGQDTAPQTSPAYAASPSASSNQKGLTAWRKNTRTDSKHATAFAENLGNGAIAK